MLLVSPVLFAAPLVLLGSFLLLQTLRIRFVFDSEAFEVKTKPLDALFDSGLGSTGENFAVGGENRCSMDNECRGDRTCNSSGWCEGPSNCPSILYATEDDFMLLENEVSTLEGQV